MGIVQTVPVGRTCKECARELFVEGVVLVVEAARDQHGKSIVVDELRVLRDSPNSSKRQRYYDLEERFEQLAAYGVLEEPRMMNQLRGELWEIKTSNDRVPFYYRTADVRHCKAARLTHQFEKSKGKTAAGKIPRKHLDRGTWIMDGDRQND